MGYLYAGIEVPLVEARGKVVLLVDNILTSSLSNELVRLQQDLIGDGWTVLRHDVSRSDSVTNIKAFITADYNADPTNVNAVFLFGHVPVPYSGNIAPDDHTDTRVLGRRTATTVTWTGTWSGFFGNTTRPATRETGTCPATASSITLLPAD